MSSSSSSDEKQKGCKRAKAGHIRALIHQTPPTSLPSILKTGLKTRKELDDAFITAAGGMTEATAGDYSGQVTGVYFNAFFDDLVGEPLVGRDYWLNLVFSPVLLDRADYHINLADQNGYLLQNSFGPDHLAEMWDARKTNKFGYMEQSEFHEVVFHHGVPIQYIEEMWIAAPDEATYEERMKRLIYILTEAGTDPKTIPSVRPFTKTFPDEHYGRLCGVSDPSLAAFKPNFCAAFPSPERQKGNARYRLSEDMLHKIARNCNISDKQLADAANAAEQTLIDATRIKRDLDPSLVTATVYEPPFTSKSGGGGANRLRSTKYLRWLANMLADGGMTKKTKSQIAKMRKADLERLVDSFVEYMDQFSDDTRPAEFFERR